MNSYGDKTNVKQSEIAADICRRVRTGELPPGSRLPGHKALVGQYNGSLVTVQRAVERLIEQGIIESIPRKGRFVARNPPFAQRVGLVFPGHPEPISSYRWTHYLEAVGAAAQRLNERISWNLIPYFDVEPTEKWELSEGYQSLLADVHSHVLGGLVFCYSPHNLIDTELLRNRDIPMVGLTGGPGQWGSGLHVNRRSVLEKAVAHLVKHECRRFAWLPQASVDPYWLRESLDRLNRRYDFYAPSRWIHPLNQFHPKWVVHTLKTMFDAPPQSRPDGIVILDDHLIAPVIQAIQSLELAVPDDVRLVGYWNFPLKYEGEVPVTRVGLDVIEQLEAALAYLAPQDVQQAESKDIELEPVFESEFREKYGPDAEVLYKPQSDVSGNDVAQ